MFRRMSVLLLALLILVMPPGIKLWAEETSHVKDFLDYLTTEEIDSLQSQIEEIQGTYGLDAVIVITDDTEGKSSMEFADDYYDYNGYGIGDDYSGLLMLINMEEREVWISTTGKAIDIFTDDRIYNMVSNITSYLGEGNFYDGGNSFLEDTRTYARLGVPQDQARVEDSNPGTLYPDIRPKPTYLQKVGMLIKTPLVYIVSLLIAAITTIILSLSSKGKVTTTNRTYEEGFSLLESRDDFIRETTTRTKIKTENNNTGGSISSTHTGSSGRSHGGGGGKF